MQDKYGFDELYGIDGTISAAGIVFNNLKYSGAAESLEHLCGIVLITRLSKGERVTKESPYVGR